MNTVMNVMGLVWNMEIVALIEMGCLGNVQWKMYTVEHCIVEEVFKHLWI